MRVGPIAAPSQSVEDGNTPRIRRFQFLTMSPTCVASSQFRSLPESLVKEAPPKVVPAQARKVDCMCGTADTLGPWPPGPDAGWEAMNGLGSEGQLKMLSFVLRSAVILPVGGS